MARKPTITIVGAGSLANALAVALRRAGYRIGEVVSQERPASQRKAQALAKRVGAQAAMVSTAKLAGDVVWLCVPDDAIRDCAAALAKQGEWRGKVALHSSGALSSDELARLRKRGAAVGTLHPMMTFVRGEAPSLAGVAMAVEGDARATRVAMRIAQDLGGKAFSLDKKSKPLYHALGSFSSPLLLSLLVTAEEVARAAGLSAATARAAVKPILYRTLDNYFQNGAARAFSGPLIRGDVRTIEKHLRELKRAAGAREVYVALVRAAIRKLPVKNRRELEKIVK